MDAGVEHVSSRVFDRFVQVNSLRATFDDENVLDELRGVYGRRSDAVVVRHADQDDVLNR